MSVSKRMHRRKGDIYDPQSMLASRRTRNQKSGCTLTPKAENLISSRRLSDKEYKEMQRILIATGMYTVLTDGNLYHNVFYISKFDVEFTAVENFVLSPAEIFVFQGIVQPWIDTIPSNKRLLKVEQNAQLHNFCIDFMDHVGSPTIVFTRLSSSKYFINIGYVMITKIGKLQYTVNNNLITQEEDLSDNLYEYGSDSLVDFRLNVVEGCIADYLPFISVEFPALSSGKYSCQGVIDLLLITE